MTEFFIIKIFYPWRLLVQRSSPTVCHPNSPVSVSPRWLNKNKKACDLTKTALASWRWFVSHLNQTSEFSYSPSIFVNERVQNSRLKFCSQYRTHHSQELVQFTTFEIINVLFLDRGLFFPVSLTGYKQYFAFDSGCLYAKLQKQLNLWLSSNRR